MATLESLLAELGLDVSANERDIRRAYAAKLKQLDPEADPIAFQNLHELYQILLGWSRSQKLEIAQNEPDPAPPPPDKPSVDKGSAVTDTEPALEEEGAAIPGAYEEAQQVFNSLLEKIDEQHSRFTYERFSLSVPSLLKSSLDDPALISIEAKDLFEWCIAQHLVRGWRTGNEALFDAAIEVFGWEKDECRLGRFGNVGAHLNAAITEMLIFKAQEQEEWSKQKRLLRKLRSSEEPNTSLLLQNTDRIEHMVKLFPALLSIVVSEEQVVRWRKQNQDIPAWQRKLTPTFGADLSKPAVVKESSGSAGYWVWIVIMILTALSRCASMSSPSVASHQLPSNNTGESATRIAKGFSQPVFLPPPSTVEIPSQAEIKKKFTGKATTEKCLEAASLGEAYRLESAFPLADLGPAYDRYVGSCVIARRWPLTPQSNQLAIVSTTRERDRLAKEMRASPVAFAPKPVRAPVDAPYAAGFGPSHKEKNVAMPPEKAYELPRDIYKFETPPLRNIGSERSD